MSLADAAAIDLSCDGHVHTPLCGHASGSMPAYVERALALGLKEIVFLEHLECGIDYFERTWLTERDFFAYFDEGRRLQDTFGHRIAIRLGVEVGYNPAALGEIERLLARFPWDRIGLSCHFLPVAGGHCNLLSRKSRNWEVASAFGVERAVEWYYRALIEGMARIPAQVVCHLDTVLRFHPAIGAIEQAGYIDEALAAVRRHGLALEANTSGFSRRGEPFPDRSVLRRALRMGIPVWPGSDAHRPADVARFFGELEELAGERASSAESAL